MKIPFSPPYIDDDVIKEVTESLTSGWITTGPKTLALEQGLASYCKVGNVNCVNSWTSGATLVLRWLGVKKGDEVIVPAYTYCATALAVMEAGAKPVMVDINSNLTIDTQKLEQAITEHTKAIIPVDLGGVPCDYKKIKEIITSDNIKAKYKADNIIQAKLGRILLLSDSAHSIGATNYGKSIAQMTDVAVISLHAVKNITSAEGGAICLNLPEPFDNEELHKKFKVLSLNGQTKDSFTKTQAGAWRYDVVDWGMKINLPDVGAAIALSQLRKYDYLLGERKRVYEHYSLRLKQEYWAILPFQDTDNIKTSYHLFPLRINPITQEQRDELINYMAQKGIATNVHYIPMPMLTLFKNMGYDIKDYPASFDAFSREITLPIYPQLTNQMIDFILDTLIEGYCKITLK